MTASLSLESRIENGLRQFQCSGRSFVEIARSLGVQTSKTQFAEQIKTGLDRGAAERLLEILERMASLQTAVDDAAKCPVVIDWTKTENIVNALVVRLVAQCDQDQRFVELADQATKAVSGERHGS
jgi:hypothetical protein